jgi:hypothetical protein
MSTTHHQHTTESGTPGTARSASGRTGVIAGAGALLACAVACSLPLLLAGGAAVTVTSLASGAEMIACGALLLTVLVGGGLWLRRRRARAAGTGCGCGGSCGC